MKKYELLIIIILSMGAGIGWHSLMIELGALQANLPICQSPPETKK